MRYKERKEKEMEKNLIQKNAAAMQQKKNPTLADYVRSMQKGIEKALPSVLTPERFSRIVLSALSNNPQLAACDPKSFLGAMMTSAQLGLEPNTPLGQAYLIPFRNNKKGITECQFQIGYKGLIDLAYRSGEIKTIQAHVVYENDDFEFEFGLEPKLMHKPAKGPRGNAIYVYAVFQTKDGGTGYDVMSMEDILQHAKKYSKSYSSGPWQTNFEEMAKKTVLKRVLKYAPLKSDYVKAAAADEMVIKAPEETTEETIPADYEVMEMEVPEDMDTETGEQV